MRAPTELLLDCKVRGCGEQFRVPIVYREEPVEFDTGTVSNPTARYVTTRLVVDVEAVVALEAVVRAHLDAHATDGAPPPVDPPAWPDVEWCDGGGSCEHEECMTRGEPEDDEPEGWRIP